MSGSPEHSAIGNIHRDILFTYWVLLHYNMSFQTIAGEFNGAFHFMKIKIFFFTNLPKLSCGFNLSPFFDSDTKR